MQESEILLTSPENELFHVLVESLRRKRFSTTIRVAGGWVRDKLLGLPNDDIDVALDDISGLEFANAVNEYLSEIGKETRSVAIIQANPDQSKHLETANVRVLGFEIDCVNLRAETYTEVSRIPEMRFGTAYEDCMRRDFTINSLFFNLNTGEIEDLSGRGREDLQAGIVRTPLSPFVTFKDDPLRVLRAIRFACRYNFKLEEELCKAAGDAEIQECLRTKVSVERVLKELEGMLTGASARPALALHTIYKLGLWSSVFPIKLDISKIQLSGNANDNAISMSESELLANHLTVWEELSVRSVGWLNVLLVLIRNSNAICSSSESETAITLLGNVAERQGTNDSGGSAVSPVALSAVDLNSPCTTPVTWRHAFYATAVSGLCELDYKDKKSLVPLPQAILRECMRADGDVVKTVGLLLSQRKIFAEYSVRGCSLEEGGMLVRSCGEHWRIALLTACALEIAKGRAESVDELFGKSSTMGVDFEQTFFDGTFIIRSSTLEVIHRYRWLQTVLLEGRHLEDSWKLKPLLDGNRLQKDVGIQKGPALGKALDAQIRWQLRNPTGTEEECILFLKNEFR